MKIQIFILLFSIFLSSCTMRDVYSVRYLGVGTIATGATISTVGGINSEQTTLNSGFGLMTFGLILFGLSFWHVADDFEPLTRN